jgi:hypothetical protein
MCGGALKENLRNFRGKKPLWVEKYFLDTESPVSSPVSMAKRDLSVSEPFNEDGFYFTLRAIPQYGGWFGAYECHTTNEKEIELSPNRETSEAALVDAKKAAIQYIHRKKNWPPPTDAPAQ